MYLSNTLGGGAHWAYEDPLGLGHEIHAVSGRESQALTNFLGIVTRPLLRMMLTCFIQVQDTSPKALPDARIVTSVIWYFDGGVQVWIVDRRASDGF